jgi:ribonuclease HI
MATLPTAHPLFPHIRRAAKRAVKRHRAPLHGLFEAFGILPERIETVDHVKADRGWRPTFKTRIAKSRDEAIEMDDVDSAAIQVYTDGSGIDGKIGAAAVLYRNGRKIRTLRYHLGSEDEHTVPEAEAVALILALELVRKERRAGRVSLAADNVGSIWRSMAADARPMQYIWEIFQARWRMVSRKFPGMALTIRWVPGHEGVRGNEEADRLAKMAALQGSSDGRKLPGPLRKPLPQSKAAAARRIYADLQDRAKKIWRDSARYEKWRHIDRSLPSGRFLKLVEGLTRHQASLIMQLRSGHAPLHDHLHRINAVDTASCPGCGSTRETVHHFLMVCPAYNEQRQRMTAGTGRGAMWMGKLLSDPKLTKRVIRYITDTGRFGAGKTTAPAGGGTGDTGS